MTRTITAASILIFVALVVASMWFFFYGGPVPSVDTPVSHVEVESWDDSAIGVIVHSCNGSPRVERLEETPSEVRVHVVATQYHNDRLGLWEAEWPGRDCFDTVGVELGSPLGERAVVDLVSGERITEIAGRDR